MHFTLFSRQNGSAGHEHIVEWILDSVSDYVDVCRDSNITVKPELAISCIKQYPDLNSQQK